ncbi:MAG: DNA gyrase/topoisomerase IV subunit A [Flavobacteriales bacterium]|nr:DNA gyrase/topoisomerase IV subunit A [Flavobacteriales bacterium]MCB9448271.1 DNA gyrase/topoisomerase IV subunit A [Flavobacteriales bacterium]
MSEEEEHIESDENGNTPGSDEQVVHLSGMYKEWFLDYASYVILERAVPAIEDGLKPVQRRILHSMRELEDGRYHKVANLIGHTMKYHPHGDASIGDALVQIGQKDLLIDCQGNWGNILTGDGAAAARYIEARLTKFALEVVFNHKTTQWLASYDGRAKEPMYLPVKFPLLLAQGAEGIAVGLSTRILPHNFNELVDASIRVLRGQKPTFYPDFPTGGMADFSNYNDGQRGGKVRVRARIAKDDNKTLRIYEIPFGTTTSSLIESIIKANDKGKIKVRKIEDNTAEHVEILVHLATGVSPDKMIDALYAFTDCEVSISPNTCVIEADKPRFIGVSEMLQVSTDRTLELLKMELEIRKGELEEQWHFASLEKIFIEKRIYRKIEECETWEEILETIHKGLKPYVKDLVREVTDEDVTRLTEIRIKRISKFDSFKADELIKKLEEEIKQVKYHLKNLVDYAIEYFKNLKKKYGEGRERKTEIKTFDTIQATKVAVANAKLYVDKVEGFIGHGLKRTESEYVCDCSDIDDIIVFREDGKMIITRITDKTFVGKGIIHAGVWKKGDERTVYNIIYQDGKMGAAMVKRFAVTGITRDKEYDLARGKEGSRILYFSANPNGEAEVVTVHLRPKPSLRRTQMDLNFADVMIKGRGAGGNIVTKNAVRKVVKKEEGISTLGARKIWFDDVVHRLNSEDRGTYLGQFRGEDKIFAVYQSGNFVLYGNELSTHFEDDLVLIEKHRPAKVVTAIYLDGEKGLYYAKRFTVEPGFRNKTLFIPEEKDTRLEMVTTKKHPVVQISFYKEKGKDRDPEEIDLVEFIGVKGFKAKGKMLSNYRIKDIVLLASEEEEEEEEEIEEVILDEAPDEQMPEKSTPESDKEPDAPLTEVPRKIVPKNPGGAKNQISLDLE